MSEAIVFLAPALVMCVVIASIHVYLGMHILAREIIFVDLSLAQLAALGSATAIVAGAHEGGYQAHAAALVFTLVGAFVFATMRRARHHVSQEAIIGVVFAVASAVMILVLSRSSHGAEHVHHALVGALLVTTWMDVARTLLIYIVIGALFAAFSKQFTQMSWDPDAAEKTLRNVTWWEFVFYGLFGVVITVSVQVAGVLLVFSFLIVPAVLTSLFTQAFWPRLIAGWLIALIASLLGLWASWSFDLPTGAAVVSAFGALLLVGGTLRLTLANNLQSSP